jgi:hypothetical protein
MLFCFVEACEVEFVSSLDETCDFVSCCCAFLHIYFLAPHQFWCCLSWCSTRDCLLIPSLLLGIPWNFSFPAFHDPTHVHPTCFVVLHIQDTFAHGLARPLSPAVCCQLTGHAAISLFHAVYTFQLCLRDHYHFFYFLCFYLLSQCDFHLLALYAKHALCYFPLILELLDFFFPVVSHFLRLTWRFLSICPA